MYNIASSSSNIKVSAFLFRECLKKTNKEYFCPHFGKFNFRVKLHSFPITIWAKRLHVWHPRGILNRNYFLVYSWPLHKICKYLRYTKMFPFFGYHFEGELCWFFTSTRIWSVYGQESPGWISLFKLVTFLLLLKIYRNFSFFGKVDLSLNSGPRWAGDN